MASGRSANARPAGRRRVAGQRAHPAARPGEAAAPDQANGEMAAASTVDGAGTAPEIVAPDQRPAVDEQPDAAGDRIEKAVAEDRTDAGRIDSRDIESDIASRDIDSGDSPDVPRSARARLEKLPGWLPVVSCVMIVVFLATSAVLGWRLYEGHAREVSRNDVLRIVPSYAAKIFSFDYRHLDQDAKDAHPLLVGAYRQDYDKSMKRRSADYVKYHYIVKSTVASAGVSEASADQVRVVALIDQTVTAGVPKSATVPEQTRLAMTFERHDGKWLLAKIATL